MHSRRLRPRLRRLHARRSRRRRIRESLRRQSRSGWTFATASAAATTSAASLLPAGRVALNYSGAGRRRGIGKMHGLHFDRISGIVHGIFGNLAERQLRLRFSGVVRVFSGAARCGLRGVLRHKNWFRGGLRSWYWQWSSQARQCFFCFFLPVRATESFRGDRKPLHGVLISFGFLFDDTELPGDHRVAGALIQLGKFRFCVGAVLRFANTRLNLPPISHGGHCSSRVRSRPTKPMLRASAAAERG